MLGDTQAARVVQHVCQSAGSLASPVIDNADIDPQLIPDGLTATQPWVDPVLCICRATPSAFITDHQWIDSSYAVAFLQNNHKRFLHILGSCVEGRRATFFFLIGSARS